MDALARVVHHAAFRYGDAYLTVGWDDGRGTPRYSIEDTRQVRPVYDTRHQLAVVYKCWEETTGIGPAARTWLRINKYQPGLIEKFVGAASGTRMDYYDGDGDGGVILWVDRSGEPLPIPIVHFRNLPRGSDYGRSELADVVPEQDEFNRRTWATGQAAVFDGARIKFGLNVQPMTDPDTGEPKAPPMGPNVFWYMNPLDPEKPAELATLDSGDLGQLQEVADRQLKTIAGLAGIPIHLIWPGGGLPSGESLKVAESRLVAKLHDRTVSFGNDWEDTQYLALKLAETFGRISVPEGVQLTTEWASIETRSALTDEQVIDLRKDDLSWRQRMRERGYTEDEIALIEAEREADRETAVGDAAQMAEATTEMKEPEPEPHAAADPARSR
jgi:hypothetical protein